jgi:murein DD-endopeptidase MepM/ murein hydrolase activator NlpD
LGIKPLVVIFFTAFCVAAAQYQPLGRTAYLTSSFGESRGARYHAGIDFSTNKEEGWTIIAPSDGVIEFAARGAFGYGRHIKFKAKDEHVWLFAHLSQFSSRIDSLIRKEMLKKEKPSVSLSLKVRFKKGDTLAYSGSTGIGDPHLHIERRTEDSKIALNPCKNMKCTDTIAPFILEAAPFGEGFAVKIVDYSREPLENPMSIYSLDIYQSKEIIFSKKYDSLSFSPKEMAKIKNDLVEVENDSSAGNWHFINVKIKANSKILVVAKDFAGNVSKKELVLQKSFLKRKAKDIVEVLLDTVPPSLGKVYLKTDFAERLQCRIPVQDSLSGLNFDSVDFRDKNGKWIIFDYHLNSKELVVERRDFDFSEPLNIKLCDKAKNCTEGSVRCANSAS